MDHSFALAVIALFGVIVLLVWIAILTMHTRQDYDHLGRISAGIRDSVREKLDSEAGRRKREQELLRAETAKVAARITALYDHLGLIPVTVPATEEHVVTVKKL